MRPVLKATAILCPSDDSYLIYDLDTGRLHRLNPLAALIAETADGELTVSELAEEIAPFLNDPCADRYRHWIDLFIAQGLLIDSRMAKSRKPLTAEDLTALALGLRFQDRRLAAFLCQKRATELAPHVPRYWLRLSELAQSVGHESDARAAFDRYRQLSPTRATPTPWRLEQPATPVSEPCLEVLYRRFRALSDGTRSSDKDNRAPELLFAALNDCQPLDRHLKVLEIGCGTGRFGQLIKSHAQRLVGIDFSRDAIEQAHQQELYDHLECTELLPWLSRKPTEQFDLIVLCDTLNSFGDLELVLLETVRHLAPGGRLGFTLDKGGAYPFQLTNSGRFIHHWDHLSIVTDAIGYRIVRQTEKVLRLEEGDPVMGYVTVLGESEES